ncbi:Uncharacterised protein [Vibrio cholerae]|nr:Uncharacterised protein [Vibrio cholerae]
MSGLKTKFGCDIGVRYFFTQAAGDHFTLSAKAFNLFHRKTRVNQAAADKASRSKGGAGTAIFRQFHHTCKQVLIPHFGVFAGSKTIEEPCID